ncbi:hypothetical protein M885DRAFT_533102 [Pelagophyceae sp. CCMP2097]|nr:hypothetical protein M885DRAFT_533102 [Pelagophyceae sp. CCMP2097]
MPIEVLDLGLNARALKAAEQWRRTIVLPLQSVPGCHNRSEVHLVGWKAAVLLGCLERHARCLWLDANAEARRPLASVRAAIDARGYFLTVAGHSFPTPKTVRPATLRLLGCDARPAQQAECTSAYLGVRRGSLVHTALLPAMDACSRARDCLYPPDSVGNTNQRRDQSALNAAICRVHAATEHRVVCQTVRKFWMWHGQATLLPTSDAAAWNSVVLFSRRAGAPPYAPSLSY